MLYSTDQGSENPQVETREVKEKLKSVPKLKILYKEKGDDLRNLSCLAKKKHPWKIS